MSIAYWCVLAAGVLPYGTVAIAKAFGSYDNRNPRAAGTYEGFSFRAFNAHQNGLEAFPFFAVAVLVASSGSPHAEIGALDLLALAWVSLRIAYIAAYLLDRPNLRSLAWIAGFAITLTIFVLPLWHG